MRVVAGARVPAVRVFGAGVPGLRVPAVGRLVEASGEQPAERLVHLVPGRLGQGTPSAEALRVVQVLGGRHEVAPVEQIAARKPRPVGDHPAALHGAAEQECARDVEPGPDLLLHHWDGNPAALGYLIEGVEEIGGSLPGKVRAGLHSIADDPSQMPRRRGRT